MSDEERQSRRRHHSSDDDDDEKMDGHEDRTENGDEDEEANLEPIGTYAVIPEDPPIVLGPANSLEKKIIKQVEYYFGDLNLPRDRFLQEQIREDADGWVSLAIMTKFNRLKAMTSNLKMIATALRKSESGLLEVSKDGVYVRRNPDKVLPENTEERRNDLQNRSVYAKGLPKNMSLDKIIKYFEDNHGLVETIFMKRDENKKFKGSVFAVFSKQSDADKFLGADEIKCEDTALLRTTKVAYLERKQEERKQKRLETLKRKREEQKKREEEELKKLKESITPGAVLHMTGFKNEETLREDVKAYFDEYGTISWIDFDTGDKEAWVRFEEANKATEVLQAAKDAHEGKIVIKDDEMECDILEGDVELDHWRKIFRDQKERRDQKKKERRMGHKRRHGHGRDGPRTKRDRRDDSDDDSDADED